MAQKTIAELEELPTSRGIPYSGSLMAKVIKIGHVAKFTSSINGEDSEMINFSLADTTGAIRATCTDASKGRMIKEGKTLHIREFVVKNGRVAMSHKTKLMAKANMANIPNTFIEKAKHLILPPSPIKKIEELLQSPLQTISTVQGQLTKIESEKTVKVSGTETTIRTVCLEENGRRIDVTLWRELAAEDLRIGQFISITHCNVCEWQCRRTLNTTRNSKIQVIQPLTSTVRGWIESLTVVDLDIEIALKEPTKDQYNDFTLNLEIIKSMYPATQELKNEDLENYLLEKLPIEVELTVQGSTVQSLRQIQQDNMDYSSDL